MHYYKFNIGDYKSHTDHLEPLEDLAYRRMIDWCYLNEMKLPLDVEDIGRLIRMRAHADSIKVVLKEFFEQTKGGYIQARIEREIETYREKCDKSKKAAEARWNSDPSNSGGLGHADALPPDSDRNAKQETITTKHKPITIKPKTNIELVFEHWQLVMKSPTSKLGDKRSKAIAKALRTYTVDQLKLAIDGCSKTPHNMGRNDQGKKYNDIELICRDETKTERFIENANNPYLETQLSTVNQNGKSPVRKTSNDIANDASAAYRAQLAERLRRLEGDHSAGSSDEPSVGHTIETTGRQVHEPVRDCGRGDVPNLVLVSGRLDGISVG